MKKKKERRVYLPRVLGSGRVMMPADLKRLHKYMLEIEHISVISDEVRAVHGFRCRAAETLRLTERYPVSVRREG
jgi:hypothetical protein